MIFVSVGTQLPFNRLIRAVEAWAIVHGCADEVFYQIGDGTPPLKGAWTRQLAPDKFEKHCREAELIVSHAGTGVLMVASAMQRKLLVFPRRFLQPGEIRNDHQMDTARRWVENHAATVAFNVEDLHRYLNTPECIIIPDSKSSEKEDLINAVRLFIHTGTLPLPKKH